MFPEQVAQDLAIARRSIMSATLTASSTASECQPQGSSSFNPS